MTKPVLFKQLFDQTSGTFSYLLADAETRDAVFIDTVYEQHERDLSLVQELNLNLLVCLETQCHADRQENFQRVSTHRSDEIQVDRQQHTDGVSKNP